MSQQGNVFSQTGYNLVILDFHGTMTDHQLRSIRSYHKAGHEAFGVHFGKEIYQGAMTRPSHASREGNGETNRQFITSQFGEGRTQEKIDEFIRVWTKVMKETYIPIPEIKETIKDLAELGTHVVLLTNGSEPNMIRETLRDWDPENKYRIRDLSENVYSAVELGGESAKKPSTVPLDAIFKELEEKGHPVDKRRTLLVGDAIVDTQLAKAANVDCALMVRGNGQEQFLLRSPRPKYIILNSRELVEIARGNRFEETALELNIHPFLWNREAWHTPHRERL